MKAKTNARQKREAETLRRKEAFAPKKEIPGTIPPPAPPEPDRFVPETFPDRTPEEDTLELLAYLDRHGVPAEKRDPPVRAGKPAGASGGMPELDLEAGMPLVSEALGRMRTGIQEMRVSRVKAVKLIHGYGSTGRGGKICPAVRRELADMKRRKLIADYIPGEDFGPLDAASRNLAEKNRNVSRDPDYGRMNHGITVVAL